MTEIPVVLTVLLSVGTAAALVLGLALARSHQKTKRSRQRTTALEAELRTAAHHHAALTTRVQATEAEVRHLAGARVPDLAASLAHSHVPVRGPLDPAIAGSALEEAFNSVLAQVDDAVVKERVRVDAAAQAAMRGASTTIQALLYQLQSLLQTMQEKHDDPFIAEDLLAADFLNEQALRRVQSTAVVCGAWPGLTRENSHLADIVVGAMSRLTGYERVQVTNQLRDPVGVVARAVEPVAVVLTELIANALHYSHPELPVAVTLQQGNKGASVIIDDAGVGMHTEELQQAARLMAGADTLLLTELGDPPRTGFAVVGQLVRQYGFTTYVEASPYGGVRAIVHIPGDPLLTLLDEAEQPMSAMAPLPAASGSHRPPLPGRASTQHPPVSQDLRARQDLPGTADARAGDPFAEPSDAGAEADDTELPRRRRRRSQNAPERDPAAAGHPQQPYDATGPYDAAAPYDAVGPHATAAEGASASPEESAQRWAAFQQGTASGRAAAEAEAPSESGATDPSGPPSPADPRSAEGNTRA
ncbi:ATP-binding protein [Streptomyces iconiensis]|uniref:histidine kinase n=1 Tax=Streptomyces iconiensis TaxID=1384038 RepID=A0ABT7A0F7_9ACTN|nr:ATP-binding protein [Streptomyces iconiensis]MDJ1134113.1 sensor histidine kinase [Streptomyces iconiensis]